MSKDFYTSLKNRRSYYGISKESPISDDRIEEIIGYSLKHTPSAYNSQTSKAILLFGEHHDKLWDIVMETLRKNVPADHFKPTENKVNSFKAGHGTVLYFLDDSITDALVKQFPLYSDNFPIWAEQANGMLQLAVWNALELEGLGANLQHYNPIIDEEVKKTWKIPDHWRLRAQMPFGTPTAMPGEKEFHPLSERLKVFK
ncbi:MAG: nitroreductase family protein [Eubacterium sp.]